MTEQGAEQSVLEGAVSSLIFQNEENGYTILRLDVGEEEMTVVGSMPGVSPGEYLTVQGQWVRHATYGVQFRADVVERRLPQGMKEIYLYSVVVAVAAVLLMRVAAPWMVAFVSGSSEPIVLENGARYLLWNAPFYAVLGILLSTRYALQSLGNKVLPLFSSVIELVGKVVFVVLFIPKFGYDAVILCEPIIWCVMAAYLVAVYRHDPFVFPKQEKR